MKAVFMANKSAGRGEDLKEKGKDIALSAAMFVCSRCP
jgi:hypothetical protein